MTVMLPLRVFFNHTSFFYIYINLWNCYFMQLINKQNPSHPTVALLWAAAYTLWSCLFCWLDAEFCRLLFRLETTKTLWEKHGTPNSLWGVILMGFGLWPSIPWSPSWSPLQKTTRSRCGTSKRPLLPKSTNAFTQTSPHPWFLFFNN